MFDFLKRSKKSIGSGGNLPLNEIQSYTLDQLDRLLFATSGEAYAVAKRVATVYACVRLLSDAVATLPVKLHKVAEDGTRYLGKSDPLYWVLNTRPCRRMDAFRFWKFAVNSLLLRGIFCARIIRSGNGKIAALDPIRPDDIEVKSIRTDLFGGLVIPATIDGERRLFTQRELLTVYYETLDGVRPASPMEYAAATMKLARESELYGLNVLDKAAIPAGYYSTETQLTSEALTSLRKQLQGRTIRNAENLILPYGIKYNTVTMTAADMQMLETRRYQKEEICSIFGVPPHLIGDTAQAKGWSTMEQTMTEFLQMSLAPILVRIEKAITTDLIPESEWGKSYAKFEVSGLLRGDLTSRTNFYKTLNMVGALSANEIREKEDMNPVEGGDQYFVQANMANANEESENDDE